MKRTHSVVVALDGQSKCGKTTIAKAITQEAQYQAGLIPQLLQSQLGERQVERFAHLQAASAFRNIVDISAGNVFRAGTLLAMTEDITAFTPSHANKLRAVLATKGIESRLQHDPDIKRRVATVAKMAGAQALCGAVFCDDIIRSYDADGGANLVIIDARDPLGHLLRNNKVGHLPGQVHPVSILPVYIDTPTDAAACRMPGDYTQNYAEIAARRHEDANRPELPVVMPSNLTADPDIWLKQFGQPDSNATEVADPYWFVNGQDVSLNNVQYFAGRVAEVAQTVGYLLGNSATGQATTV